ncbi:MAG: T9SS type A sorting domain-containing protein [Bacteroidota bacterium]
MRSIIILLVLFSFSASAQFEVSSDHWSTTDALGRTALLWYSEQAEDAKPGKLVGMFYHTWHIGHHVDYTHPVMNLTQILASNDESVIEQNWDHSAWGGLPEGGTYYWDESLFGYYRTTDEWVLRKHAEMLADAGVDVVFFDATNGSVTWKEGYTKLLEVWKQARADGVKTPQIAFVLTLWDNIKEGALAAINQLYEDLYKNPGEYEDLIFYWEGKPLIMAYPEILEGVPTADNAAMKFTATSSFKSVGMECPSYSNNTGSLTISLYKWNTNYATTIAGTAIASKEYVDFNDNSRLFVDFSAQPAGDYVIKLSNAKEVVGVYKFDQETSGVTSYFNGSTVSGDYMSYIVHEGSTTQERIANGTSWTASQIGAGYDPMQITAIKNHFTFRPGQGDYVNGPASRPANSPNWGWLEVYPQHAFANNEQVTVGIAQNASANSNNHCTAFNGPDTYGRNYSKKTNTWDTGENAMYEGANFQEQWIRALELNPELVFVTGWNEWTIGRWRDWTGCTGYAPVEVSFQDAVDGMRSRDIEPVKSWGKYGDAYYVQLVDNVRKFKGMSKPITTSDEKTISIGSFDSWSGVFPEFKHYKGNTISRNHQGAGNALNYTNTTGRNDIVLAKVARDADNLYFYVETNDNLTPTTDEKWMRLFIDVDRNKTTGWEGYDYVLNRVNPGTQATLEKSTTDSWNWTEVGQVDYAVSGKMMEIAIPRSFLGLTSGDEIVIDFKWSDNSQVDGDIMDFYINGDAAPGGRFNFGYYTSVEGIELGINDETIKSSIEVYPNPFQKEINIEFELQQVDHIKVSILNNLGQEIVLIADEKMKQGANAVVWNGTTTNGTITKPGTYYYRIESNSGLLSSGIIVKY